MRNFPHVWKRAFGPQKPKTILWVNFSEFGFFFYHVRVWCSGDLELRCMPCARNQFEEGWESVISLPSEVVSGSLLRLFKFLPVFKLTARFAAGSALMRSVCLPWEWSWSLRAIELSRYVLVALRHGAKFRGEARLVVFLLPRCGFPVVCYSQRVFNMFKSSVTAQEELVRTQRLPFASIHTYHYCQARSQGIRKGGYIFRGVWGNSPRKILNSRWRIPQNLMISFNCQRNFGCPII